MFVGSGIDVRGIDVLGQIFDFSGIEKSEKSIKKTWQEFRDALSKGDFSFDDIASAKKNTFLRVYDDLFNKNAGIEYNTVLISEIEKYCVGRGTILGEDENPDFERFIPKTEFIKEDNRFSPSGVEWLYLAIGEEAAIHECTQAECRAKQNDRFGFCHFQFAADSTALKVVDLTIADEYVEYGTTNPLTILLQRNGFSRESARFIKENPEYVVKDGSTGKLKLKASLSKCGRTSVENEVEYIRQNIPGIFVDEED